MLKTCAEKQLSQNSWPKGVGWLDGPSHPLCKTNAFRFSKTKKEKRKTQLYTREKGKTKNEKEKEKKERIERKHFSPPGWFLTPLSPSSFSAKLFPTLLGFLPFPPFPNRTQEARFTRLCCFSYWFPASFCEKRSGNFMDLLGFRTRYVLWDANYVCLWELRKLGPEILYVFVCVGWFFIVECFVFGIWCWGVVQVGSLGVFFELHLVGFLCCSFCPFDGIWCGFLQV